MREREINVISAKAFKQILQRNSRGEWAYLGLIRKVDDLGTGEANVGAPSDVENLRRPGLPTVIWEVLERYEDVFPSEFPKGVPPGRMGHEFKSIWKMRHCPFIGHCTNSVLSS